MIASLTLASSASAALAIINGNFETTTGYTTPDPNGWYGGIATGWNGPTTLYNAYSYGTMYSGGFGNSALGTPVSIIANLEWASVSTGTIGTTQPLYQDIGTQHPGALVHRDAETYDLNFHDVAIEAGSRLDSLLATQASRKINSVHHQGVKDLAAGFAVEARCPVDGMVEAIRHTGKSWVAAVQWHPEFHKPDLGTLDDEPILQDFLDAARAARTPSKA